MGVFFGFVFSFFSFALSLSISTGNTHSLILQTSLFSKELQDKSYVNRRFHSNYFNCLTLITLTLNWFYIIKQIYTSEDLMKLSI